MAEKKNGITGEMNASQIMVGLLGADRVTKAAEVACTRAQLTRAAAKACEAAGLPWKRAEVLADDLEEAGEVLQGWIRLAEAPEAAPVLVVPASLGDPAPAPAQASAPIVRPADLVRAPEVSVHAPSPEPSTGKFIPGERAIWIQDRTPASAPVLPASAPESGRVPRISRDMSQEEIDRVKEERRIRANEATRARRAAQRAARG